MAPSKVDPGVAEHRASEFERAQIVVLSSIEWDSAWQRHQIFASQFAEAGHEVFFVENTGFRNPAPRDLSRIARKIRGLFAKSQSGINGSLPRGLRVVNPVVLPPTFRNFRRANASWLIPNLLLRLQKGGLRPNPIVVAYLPTATTLEIIRHLSPSSVVYDCASNFSEHPDSPKDFEALETELLQISNLVVTDSDFLFDRMKARHRHVKQIHQGVSEEFFSTPPGDHPPKRFCYYGTWGPNLGTEFLAALADAGFDVTLSAFIKAASARFPANIRRLEPVRREKLVERLGTFDAFLFPYQITRFHLGVVPAKLYECLAMGRPVIATPLPSLEPLRHLIYVADSPEDWVEIARKLGQTESPEKRAERIRLAREHTYPREFARFSGAIKEAWERRERSQASAHLARLKPHAYRQFRAFAEGISWISALYTLAKASIVFSTILAGRWLGPQEYGRANIVIALAAFISIVFTLGFPIAMTKFVSEEKEPSVRDELISTTLVGFGLFAALGLTILLLLRPALSRMLHVSGDLLGWAIAYGFLNAVHSVTASPLLGLTRFAQRGAAEVAYGVTVPLFLCLLLWTGRSTYDALVISMSASFFVGALCSMWLLRTHVTLTFRPAAFKRIGRYALVATLLLLSNAFVLGPGRLVLHKHFSVHYVGIFSAYFNSTAQISLSILYMLVSVLIPLASNPQTGWTSWIYARRLWVGVLAISWPAFALIAVAGLRLFGGDYPFDWTWILSFSGAAALILLHGIIASLFSARDFEGLCIAAAGWMATGMGNLALNLVLTPHIGITGAGISLMTSTLFGILIYAAFWPKHGRKVPQS
ncbi:MAG: oligosaccharide flippase family protein [Elusimicrobia bacterium]|nr:oligosaccharide flippase family protein [Elusimicrobiota bacterium]